MPDNSSLVIGLGELLWDCFPTGRLPGGAPANVAFHAQQLGLPAAVATRVGTDALGEELIAFLASKGLRTDLVQRDPDHGTGTVTVSPRPNGHTDYVFLENSAWDFLEATAEWKAAFTHARAVAFGTLAQRGPISRGAIHSCVRATGPECLVVYDINLRPPFYHADWIWDSLALARIVKLNDDESGILAGMLAAPAATPMEVAELLLERFPKLELVCITRGGNGALGDFHRRCRRRGQHAGENPRFIVIEFHDP
ncbi:MAG TPA: PfkB family carbohydrate kinase, partial [Planctomycetaceae bacterium]|nr:PfkB family carbohydrate kinase [Planctomycetaceae bacterium]